MFYIDGKKVLKFECLFKLLTPRALSFWYMDDGHKQSNITYIIATCGFTLEEHKLLIKIFLLKYKIQAVIMKSDGYNYLKISKKTSENDSHLIFKQLVIPYIVKSMLYKL